MNQLRKLKTDYNAKIKDIEDKTPSVTNLVPTAALTAVENKIPKVSKLVKKSDYNTFTNDIINTKIKQKESVNKSDISRFIQIQTLIQIKI